MLTAIHIGADSVLLRTRAAILETAGVRVVNAASLSLGLERLRSVPFDLVIVCHSLSRCDRLNLAGAVRQINPSAPILLVSSGPGVHTAEKDGMDAVLDAEPSRLVAGLRRTLLPLQKSGAARRSKGMVRPEAG